MSAWDSSAFVAGLVGSITAVVGWVTSRRTRGEREASQSETMGHSWSELTEAVRDEAREERETRRQVEEKLREIDDEWADCKSQLSSVRQRMNGLLEWLRSMGLEPPGWLEDDE